jgi:glyoxylase I family protein
MPDYDLDHIILEVRDPALSLAFYGDTLGLLPVREEEFTRGEIGFPSVRVGPTTLIDLFPPRIWRGSRASNPNHFALTASRVVLAEIRERLGARGIAITRADDHNFGARGYARSIYFDDPDGITVEVRTYEP